MRYDLVSHGNKRLGEVLIADGVNVAEIGREFISGRPCRLVAVEPEAAPAGGNPKDKDPKK
jgi:hypothetical protein